MMMAEGGVDNSRMAVCFKHMHHNVLLMPRVLLPCLILRVVGLFVLQAGALHRGEAPSLNPAKTKKSEINRWVRFCEVTV